MNLLITGASGFVGSAILSRAGEDSRFAPRASTARLTPHADWSTDLTGTEVVIHCAARVHVMRESAADPLHAFREVNVVGTLALAEQAAAAGVKRFIFLSTIKVNGENTLRGKPFTAEDAPQPQDAYAVSKHEAEIGLQAIAARTGMEIVVIRPPLVYGPGVKGNFSTLAKLVARGIPLPFASIHNQRSLVARDNLVDLIVHCVSHPAAANQVFLVSDDADLSTPELIRRMATAIGKKTLLLPVPASWFYAAARLGGERHIAERLCGSLQVDIEKTKKLLGWQPPHSLVDTFSWLGKANPFHTTLKNDC